MEVNFSNSLWAIFALVYFWHRVNSVQHCWSKLHVVCTSSVGRTFVGETEWHLLHQIWCSCTFALWAKVKVKLTQGVNFINILWPSFFHESFFQLLVLAACLCIFWQKEIGKKAECKMLTKLPPGIDPTKPFFFGNV